MGQVAGEKYLFQQQGTATAVRPMRERERPMVARSTEEKEEEYFI